MRLSEEVEPLLRAIAVTLPPNMATPVNRALDMIIQHVEALEDIVPEEVVTETRTAKGPPGPTTFGASP